MTKVVFAGCSFTAGTGWNEKQTDIDVPDSQHLWVNLCHKKISALSQSELINLGKGGASNTEIFENVVRCIAQHGNDIDTIFCQWTSMPRYNFKIGFEIWDTSEGISWRKRDHDVDLNAGVIWPRNYIHDLFNRFKVLHHLHWEILKVVDYCNIIRRLANLVSVRRLFFINGLCPWDDQYFSRLRDVEPKDYTQFTQRAILSVDTRDDDEIHRLYDKAHDDYANAGGINPSCWINLYNSFRNLQIDCNHDQIHPGILSNEIYYEIIEQHLDCL